MKMILSERTYFYFLIALLNVLVLTVPGNYARAQESQVIQSDDNASSRHSFYSGLGYSNSMVYMGSSISQDKPFYSGSLIYGYNDELFASASFYHLSVFDPFLSFSTYSLSYNHNFSSWFDISMGVSRYQVSTKLADTLFNNFFYGSLGAGIDWKILYTSISAGEIFSGSGSLYLQAKNSHYFQTPELFNGTAYFAFDPYFNLLFGTLTKTVTSEGTTYGVVQPYKTGKSSTGTGSGSGSGSGSNSSVLTSNVFSLMEIDFGLPVSFNTGKLTIEAEPGYVLPLYTETDVYYPEGFVFMLSCYFRIF